MNNSSSCLYSLDDLITDPNYYLWRFNGPYAVFARMNRATYRKSIFTDERIIAAHPDPIKVDLDELKKAFNAKPKEPNNLSYIFHVAHCGSTLLARALDLESKNVVYREPLVLRQLAILLAENDWGDSPPELWNETLKLAQGLLSKSYTETSPVIIKANVPVNFAIEKLLPLSVDAKGLLLYTTFENYLLAILKSDNHRQWLVSLTTTLGSLIENQIDMDSNERQELSMAQTAASLWLAQILIFNKISTNFPNFKTLDSELFYQEPASVLSAAFKLIGNSVSETEISSIVESNLFSQHAKVPGHQYDNQQRIEDRNQLLRKIGNEIQEAGDWLLEKLDTTSLPLSLPNALIGESPKLIEADTLHRVKSESYSRTSQPDVPYLCITSDKEVNEINKIDDERILNALKTRGAILLRGFSYELDSFTAFVQRFCSHSVYNPSIGREIVDLENNIQTVDLGDDAFPLHAELCREPWRPDVCFFTCETAPALGGETTLCDGVKIVEALDEETIERLQSQPLIYYQPMYAEDCKQWLNTETPSAEEINNPPASCPFQLSILDGQLTRAHITPALHKTMFSKELAFGNFLLFSRYGLNNKLQPCFLDGSIVPDDLVAKVKQVSDALTYSVRWQRGDLLMLDNTRFLHGRNKIYKLNERRIISYFGYLKNAKLDSEQANMVWRQKIN